MEKSIRVCGYVRVSSSAQVKEKIKNTNAFKDKISLSVQRDAITKFVEAQEDYTLTEIYADEGISGGTVKDRFGLQECLRAGQAGKFNMLVVYRLSRFGRNARELLENYHTLKEAGIELRSISEGIDFSTKYGQAFLGILAILAELENEIRRETLMDGRLGKAHDGAPTAGRLPIGRLWNEELEDWQLDSEVVPHIRYAAEQYLSGKSAWDISEDLKSKGHPMSPSKILATLKERCGEDWKTEFATGEVFNYKIPRILPEDTIQRIKDRIAFNRTNNRTDIKKYLLTGFLRCEKCGGSLTGWSQEKAGKIYSYYYHPTKKKSNYCDAFTCVPLEKVERAIFETVFENFADVPSFEKAIAQSLPDTKMIADLEAQIKAGERRLKKVVGELDNLALAIAKGRARPETIKPTEDKLYQEKERIESQLQEDREEFNTLPDPNTVRNEADKIRRQLLERYSGKERLSEMSYDDKRNLLFWLFEGKDRKGDSYGIYISTTGKGKDRQIDYYMYGRIVGLRTLKGDDIDYQEHLDVIGTSFTSTNKQILYF